MRKIQFVFAALARAPQSSSGQYLFSVALSARALEINLKTAVHQIGWKSIYAKCCIPKSHKDTLFFLNTFYLCLGTAQPILECSSEQVIIIMIIIAILRYYTYFTHWTTTQQATKSNIVNRGGDKFFGISISFSTRWFFIFSSTLLRFFIPQANSLFASIRELCDRDGIAFACLLRAHTSCIIRCDKYTHEMECPARERANRKKKKTKGHVLS